MLGRVPARRGRPPAVGAEQPAFSAGVRASVHRTASVSRSRTIALPDSSQATIAVRPSGATEATDGAIGRRTFRGRPDPEAAWRRSRPRDRPALEPGGAAGEQLAASLPGDEARPTRSDPIGRNASSRPVSSSQSRTPSSMPTASRSSG